jgi:hypothetical protein
MRLSLSVKTNSANHSSFFVLEGAIEWENGKNGVCAFQLHAC